MNILFSGIFVIAFVLVITVNIFVFSRVFKIIFGNRNRANHSNNQQDDFESGNDDWDQDKDLWKCSHCGASNNGSQTCSFCGAKRD